MMIRTAKVAFWALVLVNLIWGIGFVVVDKAIAVMPTNTFNAFRFGLAAFVLLPLWFFNKKKIATEAESYQVADLVKTGFGLGLLLFLGTSFQTQGLVYTSVSNTGFITGLSVPLVPIIGFLIYRTQVGAEIWFGVLMATLGLYFLTIGDKMEFNTGDILVAVCAVCYALHISVMAKVGNRFPVVPLSILQLAAVACYSCLASLAETVMGINTHYSSLVEQLTDTGLLAAIVYSGLLACAFAYWVQTSSQRLIAPHKIALIFALEPIFAHIAAFFILDEHLGLQGWLGAGLIIAGMIYSELGGNKKIKIQPLEQMAAPVED